MIIWLASYPKSGNTYLRAFLSAYYYSKDGNFDFGQIANIKQFPNKEFFNQPEEVVFRSLTQIIKIVGRKYYPVRGKKIDKTLNLIRNNASFKITLGNCLIRKVNSTIIVSKED